MWTPGLGAPHSTFSAYSSRLRDVLPSPDAKIDRGRDLPYEMSGREVERELRSALAAGQQMLIKPTYEGSPSFRATVSPNDAPGLVNAPNRYPAISEHPANGYGPKLQQLLNEGHRVWVRRAPEGHVVLLASPPFMWT